MRNSTLLLVLSLCSTLACPRPGDTEPKSASDAGAKTEATPAPTTQAKPAPTNAQPHQEPASGAGAVVDNGTLPVDRSASSIGFAVARATVGHIGKFDDFDASLTLSDGKPTKLEISVKTGSVVADRTGLTHHLKSADFFNVDKFPTATFTASEFTPDAEAGPNEYVVAGAMHLHGVERKLEFPATLEIGSDRVVGRATLDISAKSFGIDYEGMEAELAEDAVQLEIELVFPRVAGP